MKPLCTFLATCALAFDVHAGCMDGPDPVSELSPTEQQSLLERARKGGRREMELQVARLLVLRGERWMALREASLAAELEVLQKEHAGTIRARDASADPDDQLELHMRSELLMDSIKAERSQAESDLEACRVEVGRFREVLRSLERGTPTRCARFKNGKASIGRCG